jgi:hypothetical protein
MTQKSINNEMNINMISKNNHEDIFDKKKKRNDTPEQREESITCMLGDMKHIEPTASSTETVSGDKLRLYDNAVKYREQT